MDSFETQHIEFVGEQDGFPERELKIALRHAFHQFKTLRRAYLARVRYDRRMTKVALCLFTGAEVEHERLVLQSAKTFHDLFQADQTLDVLFLTSEQDKKLANCCRPFINLT